MNTESPNDFFITLEYQEPHISEIDMCGGQRFRYVRDEGTVKAEMYLYKYKELMEIISSRMSEEQIRKKNEAVNKAYEQYQMLLKLAQ
jgi:hypothetical protein